MTGRQGSESDRQWGTEKRVEWLHITQHLIVIWRHCDPKYSRCDSFLFSRVYVLACNSGVQCLPPLRIAAPNIGRACNYGCGVTDGTWTA